MQIRSVGIDLGKTTFHLVALGDNGKVQLKKKFTQKQLITFTANMQTSLIGMAKMLNAHNSITPAKVLSAKPPLPRALTNWRIGDGAPSGPDASASPTKFVTAVS